MLEWYINYNFLQILNQEPYTYFKTLKTLKVGLEVIEAFLKIPIHQNKAMEVALRTHLLMRCSVNLLAMKGMHNNSSRY